MLDMKRRKFLGISAATVAVAAIPASIGNAKDARPRIGTEFYSNIWVDAQSARHALFATRPDHFTAMRYFEIARGVRLSRERHAEAVFYPDRGAWCVTAQATVIGYA